MDANGIIIGRLEGDSERLINRNKLINAGIQAEVQGG